MTRQRILFPDFLRVLAAFLVVLIHVTSIGIHDTPVGSEVWRVCTMLNAMSRWSVSLFFMVSGMFMLDPEHPMPMDKLYRKNIARIVLCLVVWGFFYSLLDQYQFSGLSWKSPILAVYGILTNNTGYHLWFLYTLLALYIATPTLRIFTQNASKQQLEYALLVWFLFCVCVGDVNQMAEGILDIKEFFPDNGVVIVGSAGYYLFGYYLHRYPLSKCWNHRLYFLGTVFLLLMPILNTFVSPLLGNVSFSNWMGIGSCTVTLAVFVFASQLSTNRQSERIIRIMRWFSSHSFGIYLIHVSYVTMIFRFGKLDMFSSMPVLGVLGSTVLIFLLSAWTTAVLRLLPVTKQLT